MLTRTATDKESPEREQMDGEQPWCPPHDFMPTWGNPAGECDPDATVPLALCSYCGEIMPLKLKA